MENKKPEALWLADCLDELDSVFSKSGMCGEAAAELRRLYKAHDWQYRMAGERLRRVEKLEQQRDSLLEALKRIKETGVFVGAIAQEMMDSAIKYTEDNYE